MVRIPGGGPFRFYISDEDVTLEPYLLAKYEVSQGEWRTGASLKKWAFRGDDLPADFLSWRDCREFCDGTGLSIPTMEQWIFACWNGKRAHAPGADALVTPEFANVQSSSTVPVGSLLPTTFGLHDMRGNVFEWCKPTEKTYPCFGGSFKSGPGNKFAGVAPSPHAPDYDQEDFGFRPAYFDLP